MGIKTMKINEYPHIKYIDNNKSTIYFYFILLYIQCSGQFRSVKNYKTGNIQE